MTIGIVEASGLGEDSYEQTSERDHRRSGVTNDQYVNSPGHSPISGTTSRAPVSRRPQRPDARAFYARYRTGVGIARRLLADESGVRARWASPN